MSADNGQNIDERTARHNESMARIKELIEMLILAIDFRDDIISEQVSRLTKLEEDNQFQKDLIKTMEESEKDARKELQDSRHALTAVRLKRDKFKQDAASSRETIKLLDDLLCAYEDSYSEILELLNSVSLEIDNIAKVDCQISSETVTSIATGAFVCCVDGDLGKRHERWFEILKSKLPQIDFAGNIIRILSDQQRPPIPYVDVVVLLNNGLSYPDGHAIRTAIRSMKPTPHILFARSISFVLVQARKWLENKQFAHVS